MVRWLIALVLVCIAIIRYYLSTTSSSYAAGDLVRIKTTLLQIPQTISFGQRIIVGDIQIPVPPETPVEYGQTIEVIGTLKPKLTNITQVGFSLSYQSFRLIDNEIPIMRYLGKLRQTLESNLLSWLPGDTGALAGGILLGGSQNLSFSTRTAFRNTGLSHITAASGYNVSIFMSWASLVWMYIGRRRAIYFVVVSGILYMILAGLSPSIIRAGIMAMGSVLARALGRKASGGWWLVLAGTLMWLHNPQVITDIGFQLSLAATAGLVWLSGAGELHSTVWAWLLTLPIIWWHFGQISPAAIPANLIVLWMVPPVMQLTAIASGVGLLVPGLGSLLSYLAWPFLQSLLLISRVIGRFPLASLNLAKPNIFIISLYYGLTILFVCWKKRRAGV